MSTAQETLRPAHVLARPWTGMLHFRPPASPNEFLRRHRLVLPSILTLIVFLGISAAIQGGALLRLWDKPVQKAVEGARTETMDAVMLTLTQLGGHTVVVLGFLVLFFLVWRKCHSMALVLVAATAARPLLEWTLKSAVDRPRPDFDRLVAGNGPSFPTGHVLAAIALWGLLPPVIGLLTNKRFLWWCSVVLSATVIMVVAASRIYLGVHWLSDVIGGLLVGSLYLVGVERLLNWHHGRRRCELHPEKRLAPHIS
jgi:undecaprenyl-diphosphatase